MDLTSKYIKMCEKAEEIQKQGGKVGWGIGWICGNWYGYSRNSNKRWVWLPTQDQLQEMKKVPRPKGYHLHVGFDHWLTYYEKRYELETMEQLWLAYVMKEKYGKTWDNKKGKWV